MEGLSSTGTCCRKSQRHLRTETRCSRRSMEAFPKSAYSFRPANGQDASGVAACVNAAYRHYVERIGKPPGPMTDDYAEVIRERRVTVAESRGKIIGVLVLAVT